MMKEGRRKKGLNVDNMTVVEMSHFQSLVKRLKKQKRILKLILMGSGAVGKTSFLTVISTGKNLKSLADEGVLMPQEYQKTSISEGIIPKRTDLRDEDEENIIVTVYDLPGQKLNSVGHPLNILGDVILSNVDVIIFMFSVDNPPSFLSLNRWYEAYREKTPSFREKSESFPRLVLVMNKKDLVTNDEGKYRKTFEELDENALEIVNREGAPFDAYFKISCYTGEGITELIDYIILALKERDGE